MSEASMRAGALPVRASDAEREQAVEILRASYAEGRLSRAELDERISAAYTARTLADLRGVTSDLPAAISAPKAPGQTATAVWPIAGPGPEHRIDRCLLVCLLCAFPPAGIVYWILTACRRPRPSLPGTGAAG